MTTGWQAAEQRKDKTLITAGKTTFETFIIMPPFLWSAYLVSSSVKEYGYFYLDKTPLQAELSDI